MKHNILKSFASLFILLMGFKAHAQLEKNEVYLITCQTANDPYQQIVFKGVNVLDSDGSEFEFIKIDVETGNDTPDGFGEEDGEGLYPKYVQTLLNTSNATNEFFTQNNRNNYSLDIEYTGIRTHSDIAIDFDLIRNGEFLLSFDGRGPLYDMFMTEFEDVMSQSDIYGRFETPSCTSHPDLRNFLD